MNSPTTSVETVITDVAEEPVPGVITITEFEETEVREEGERPERPEETPPESEERQRTAYRLVVTEKSISCDP